MPESSAKRYLVRGGRLYDHAGDVHHPAAGDLLIRGGLIEAIAPAIAPEPDVEVIEAGGKLVIPGFVNAHYHSHDVMAKGLFEEMPFDVWTLHTNPGNFGPRSHQEVRLRTLIGAAESLRNGITTIQDFLTVVPPDDAYVDTVLSAYEEVGIRVVFAIAMRDRAGSDMAPFFPDDLPEPIRKRLMGADRKARDEIDFVARQIARRPGSASGRQTWALAASAPQRSSPELLEGIAGLSREWRLPFLTHVYETRIQAAAARRTGGGAAASLLDGLAAAGLMNERLGIVHGVWLSARDIARIAEAGARVVHNPVSNLKLKSGVAPVLDLHRAGIDISLGCDNCSCGDSQNIFTAMRMLCLLPAVTDPAPGPIDAAYALRAATLSGARAVGLGGRVGALAPGMAADLMILDLTEPAFVPFNSAARQIVHAECGRAVETVFVAGRPVVRDRRLTTIDEAQLAAEAMELAGVFRRDAAALAARNAELLPALREGARAAWSIPLDFDRYIGRSKT